MAHRRLAVLAVSLLLMTSGCLGILGMSGDSTPSPSPVATSTTPTPTPTPTTTTLSDLKADHRQALLNSSGWRLDSSITLASNASGSVTSRITVEETAKIDRANHRYWKRSGSILGPTIKYTNASVTVKKQELDGSTSYSYKRKPYEKGNGLLAMQPVNATQATGLDTILVDENVSYLKKGTAVVNGANTTKYVVHDVSNLGQTWSQVIGGGSNTTLTGTTSNVSVQNFSSVIYVETDRRIVRRAAWSITLLNERKGERVSINVSMDISQVGTVNVTAPEWMGQALNESEDESVSLLGGTNNQSACSFYTTELDTEKIRFDNGSYRVRVHIEDWGAAEAIHLEREGERRATVRKKWTDAEVPTVSIVAPDDSLVQVTATSQDCPEGRLLEFISVG